MVESKCCPLFHVLSTGFCLPAFWTVLEYKILPQGTSTVIHSSDQTVNCSCIPTFGGHFWHYRCTTAVYCPPFCSLRQGISSGQHCRFGPQKSIETAALCWEGYTPLKIAGCLSGICSYVHCRSRNFHLWK